MEGCPGHRLAWLTGFLPIPAMLTHFAVAKIVENLQEIADGGNGPPLPASQSGPRFRPGVSDVQGMRKLPCGRIPRMYELVRSCRSYPDLTTDFRPVSAYRQQTPGEVDQQTSKGNCLGSGAKYRLTNYSRQNRARKSLALIISDDFFWSSELLGRIKNPGTELFRRHRVGMLSELRTVF